MNEQGAFAKKFVSFCKSWLTRSTITAFKYVGEGLRRTDGRFRKTCIMRDSSNLCLLLWGKSCFYFKYDLLAWPCLVSVVACGVFSWGMWDLVPWPGIKPGSPAWGAQSLSHWTTREVLKEEMLLLGHYQILQGLIPCSGELLSIWMKGVHSAFPMGLWVGAGSGICLLSRDRPTQLAEKWRSKEIY